MFVVCEGGSSTVRGEGHNVDGGFVDWPACTLLREGGGFSATFSPKNEAER